MQVSIFQQLHDCSPISSYPWSCLSWFMLEMQMCGDSIGSEEANVLPQHSFALHITILHTQRNLRGRPLLRHNMLHPTLALFMRNHSLIYLPGNGPKTSADVGFISRWTRLWWLFLWSNYSAEKKECVHITIFMSWGLLCLGRLLCLPCFHYMNQKYISVGLYKRRESAVYCTFALDDDYGAQKWYWCDLSIPSTMQKKSTCCRQGDEMFVMVRPFTVNNMTCYCMPCSVHAFLLSHPHHKPYWEDLLKDRLHIRML